MERGKRGKTVRMRKDEKVERRQREAERSKKQARRVEQGETASV